MSEQKKTERVTRRGFGAIVAAAGAAIPVLEAQQTPTQTPAPAGAPNPNTSMRRPGPPPEIPPFEAPIEFTRKDVTAKVEPFPMTQVKLLPSVYTEAAEWNRGYMSRLAADRLVYNFRENAGLPVGDSKGFPGGGSGNWERPADGTRATELRGHFTGHFLSASAQLYASMGDKEAKAKADEMVAEMAKCQEKLGGKYLSAFPASFWDRLDARQNIPWAPFYTIHKIMAGMFDMYRLADNQQALKVLEGMAAWADEWTAGKPEEHMQEILKTEYGGMAETLYNLAAATNNDRWAKAGDRFTKKSFVNPLASRRDELRGLHVNTHVPQVIAAARRYEISGDMRFHDVADYFWDEVVGARSYVTGGTSNGEGWQAQPRQLAWELKRSIATAECCCVYNMLKLTRHLYSWNPQPHYFDYYERVMINHRIGTIQPKTGHTQYYLSLYPGTWKTFNTEDQSFWCCTGSGVEEYSKLNDSIYWRDHEGVYVNLFMPSELHWEEKGLKLRQETKFPDQQSTTLTVTAARPVPMAMRLRIPGWLQSSPTVKLNGKALEASAAPGSYFTLTRTWKTGDRVELELPMRLTVEAMPDDPKVQAFLYGPLVLAGDLGTEGLRPELIVGPNAARIARPNANGQGRPGGPVPAPAIEPPTFKAPGDPASWIKPGDTPNTFHTTGQQKDVALAPINSIFDRRYNVYWTVS